MKRRALIDSRDLALSPKLFRALVREVRALKTERLRSTYQTTFWWPRGSPPQNLVDLALERLAGSLHLPRSITGVEWWLSRMRTSNVKVDFHRDCDERLSRRGGAEVHPWKSSVLFLNRCRGGLLAVTTHPPNPKNVACAPDVLDFDFAVPHPNRYVHFDGRLTHGVLDARHELPLKRLPPEPDFRLAIAINYWKHRPTDVPTFAESRAYRRLAIRH